MPLSPFVDSVDDLPEAIRGEYVKYSGDDASLKDKFVLQVESQNGWALDNVESLRNSLSSERDRRSQAVAKLQKLVDDDGNPLDIEDVLANLGRLMKFDSGDFSGSEGFTEAVEALKTQLTQKHEREKGTLTEERDTAKSTLRDYVARNEAVTAISSAEGSVKGLLPHVLSSLDVQYDDAGKATVVVKNKDGVVQISQRQGSDEPMSVQEFVESLKKDDELKALFKGTAGSGGGQDPPKPGSGNHKIDPKLSPMKRIEAYRAAKAGK